MTFSENNFDRYNNQGDFEFSNKFIILKKIKSLRQLRRIEKELVKFSYKEAIIKGFTLKGVQQYIASKTKIWIEWSCLEYLKKAEEQENKDWFYYMAKDHFAYVGAYRKCIDEIEQYKKEMWNIVMDYKTDHSNRIQALKELHSLSKTYTLLIKDIPFITNLSKYYDRDIINSNYKNNPIYSKGIYSNNNNQTLDKNLIDEKNLSRPESSDNQFIFNDIKDENTLLDHSGLKDDRKDSGKYKQVDDKIMEDMQRQLSCDGTSFTPEHQENIRKLKELCEE